MSTHNLPTSPCARCQRPIVWVTTETNHKGLPVDPEPSEAGNIIVRMVGGKLTGRVVLKGEQRDGLAFVAHFATCGARERKPKVPKPPKPPQPEQLGLL